MKYGRVLFCLLLAFRADASVQRNGVWLGTFGKKPVAQNYSLWSEVQLRYNSTARSMGQTLFRGGVLNQVNENHEVGLILGYIQTDLQKEYRPTLQHIYTGLSHFSFRSRLEFRALEDNSESSFRYRMMVRSFFEIADKLDFVLWDEPFLNLTRENWTGDRFFERNRLFVGFRKKYENFNVESGYLNQFVPRQRDIQEHLLVVYINY